MIVCHCNRIDHNEIEQAANDLAAIDQWRILTPVAVYQALGKRPHCGGCLPLATSIIHARQAQNGPACRPCPFAEFDASAEASESFGGRAAGGILQAAE